MLDGWENFYVIVGSSAGALIGLQFVVMTLIAELPTSSVSPEAGAAFATPSVIHFGVVLFLCAILSAPWRLGYGHVSGFCSQAGATEAQETSRGFIGGTRVCEVR